MKLLQSDNHRGGSLAGVLTGVLLVQPALAAPKNFRRDESVNKDNGDPFAILDPQKWVNPDNMTWSDFKAPPGTNWSDAKKKGSERNFNIALVAVDYPDMPFVITQKAHSTVFNNPQPAAAEYKRANVPKFYEELLNKPSKLNNGHTLHEYWMGDSHGRFGVDLTSFGPYKLPSKAYQYGVGKDMNPGACPSGDKCDIDLRTDALGAWRKDVGKEKADSYELVFILSAGQDESSTWQEFGEMKFQSKEDVPEEFGPPGDGTNYAKTRYVDWTSWASASTIWPNAGGGSSTQGESSGMGVYAHELSHLLDIGDNYNNPYGDPPQRSFTGPWSMMSRGSFNGPGGPHSRWQIPPLQGAGMGSLHTLRDKVQLKLIGKDDYLQLSREALAKSGLVTSRVTARAVVPGKSEIIGVRISMDADNSPACNVTTDPLCDGGGFNKYDIEVVDRMGADSFTPDSGVMISKSRDKDRAPFQWTIDANPKDIKLIDFYRPDGTAAMVTIGDYRQLADALFHAGTRSGSEYEYTDKANKLHFYILDVHRDNKGILSYTTAVRSVDQKQDPHKHKASLGWGKVKRSGKNRPTQKGVTCSFTLKNKGKYSKKAEDAKHGQDVSSHLKSDVYRLKATVSGRGWKVELPNALAVAEYGKTTTVNVAVSADSKAALLGRVKLTATSESDPSAKATGQCWVPRI